MIYQGVALGSITDPGKRSRPRTEGTIETSGRAYQQRQPEVAYILSKKHSNNENGTWEVRGEEDRGQAGQGANT